MLWAGVIEGKQQQKKPRIFCKIIYIAKKNQIIELYDNHIFSITSTILHIVSIFCWLSTMWANFWRVVSIVKRPQDVKDQTSNYLLLFEVIVVLASQNADA